MDTDDHTPSVHLHIGGLIILIIITLILFKVNIKGAVSSTQFQSNISYIQQESNSLWNTYIGKPFSSVWKIISEEIKKESDNITDPTNSAAKYTTVGSTSKDSNVQAFPTFTPTVTEDNKEIYQLSRPVKN